MSEEVKAEKQVFEKKEFVIDGLGTVTRATNGKFSMNQAALESFMESRGLGQYKEFKKNEQAAIDDLTEKAVAFMGDHVVDDERDASFRAGTGNGAVLVNVRHTKVTTNPSTGEKTTKYGVVSVDVQQNVPKCVIEEGGVRDALAKRIEDSLMAKAKVKVA